MKVSILGTDYEIQYKDYADQPYFQKNGCDGYCDSLGEEESEEYCKKQVRLALRHEIIHAFLNESGLQDSSGRIGNLGWAKTRK